MDLAKVVDGKKFMWDGKTYENEADMKEVEQKYLDDGFEVQVVNEGDNYFLFSRRMVTEVTVEGQP